MSKSFLPAHHIDLSAPVRKLIDQIFNPGIEIVVFEFINNLHFILDPPMPRIEEAFSLSFFLIRLMEEIGVVTISLELLAA